MTDLTKFVCSDCDGDIFLGEKDAGTRVKCPHCSYPYDVETDPLTHELRITKVPPPPPPVDDVGKD